MQLRHLLASVGLAFLFLHCRSSHNTGGDAGDVMLGLLDAVAEDVASETSVLDATSDRTETGVVVLDAAEPEPPPIELSPPPGPCHGIPVVDLDRVGVRSGREVRYTVESGSGPLSESYAPSCFNRSGRVRGPWFPTIFRYTVRSEARLRFRVDARDSDRWLAVGLSVRTSCDGTELACGYRGPGLSEELLTDQTFARGVTLYLVAGSLYDSLGELQGRFTLTVREATPVTEGESCRDVKVACVDGTNCDRRTERCTRDGQLGGRCRRSGTPCAAGLGCLGPIESPLSVCRPLPPTQPSACLSAYACPTGQVCNAGWCRPPAQLHEQCNGSFTCAAGLSCEVSASGTTCEVPGVVEGERCADVASFFCRAELECRGGVCVRTPPRGTLGGFCRAEAPRCDDGLGCTEEAGQSPQGRCALLGTAGGRCSVGATACPTGMHCVETPSNETQCVADGRLGGRCRWTGLACDEGLRCVGNPGIGSDRCLEQLPSGAVCRAFGVCPQFEECLVVGSERRCVPFGTTENGRCRSRGMLCDPQFFCNVPDLQPDGLHFWSLHCLRRSAAGENCSFGYRENSCLEGLTCSSPPDSICRP